MVNQDASIADAVDDAVSQFVTGDVQGFREAISENHDISVRVPMGIGVSESPTD